MLITINVVKIFCFSVLPMKVKVKVKSLSCVQLFATPWTVAHQAPLSMGFSKQEYWGGLPLPSPGDLPQPGSNPPLLLLVKQILYHGATEEAPFLSVMCVHYSIKHKSGQDRASLLKKSSQLRKPVRHQPHKGKEETTSTPPLRQQISGVS